MDKKPLSLLWHFYLFMDSFIFIYLLLLLLLPPQGFRPEGEIPRRHPSNSRVYQGQYLQFKYTVSILEKLSICSNWGREESVGNNDVSIVCARKYEMVRMT